jgi:hypothetical protein
MAALLRYRSTRRAAVWFGILRGLHGVGPFDQLKLLASAALDTAIHAIRPSFAPSPKTAFACRLYAPAVDASFRVRAGTDDVYNVLPFGERDVHHAILDPLGAGDVFVDVGANIGLYVGLSYAYLLLMVFNLVFSGAAWLDPAGNIVFWSFALVPTAIGIAILRHRLFDVDVIITKAFVFGTLAAFITAVYVAVVVGLGAVLGSGNGSSVALSMFATAIVAVAFQPVRARVERVANRLVYGRRATPYDVLTRFSRSLAGATSVDDVVRAVARHTAEGLHAESTLATATLPSGGLRARYPEERPLPARRGATIEVTYRGERLGSIAVTRAPTEPLNGAERKLLAELAAHAGVVLHNARLAQELRARLCELTVRAGELRDSRERRLPSCRHANARHDRTRAVSEARRFGHKHPHHHHYGPSG